MTNDTGVTKLSLRLALTHASTVYNKPTEESQPLTCDRTVRRRHARVRSDKRGGGAVTSYQVTNLVSGLYWYVVRATNDTAVSENSNVIRVNTAAMPPQIEPFTPQTVRVGATFTCDVVINETNGDPVTETNVTAAGVSGAWSLNAGVFTYTPVAADKGVQTFTFTAQDKDGWSEPRDLVITVLPACVPAVVMTGVSGTYSQTFEALGRYGGSTVWDNAAEPLHAWYAYVKNAPVTSFIYGTGSGTAGALYAFSFEGSNTYSLGSLAGGKRDYVYGMALTNASDNAVTECVIQSRRGSGASAPTRRRTRSWPSIASRTACSPCTKKGFGTA